MARSATLFILTLASPALPGAAAADTPSFTDHTEAAGLTFLHQTATPESDWSEPHMMTPGVAAADFDRDGALDLLVLDGAGFNARLFLNDGHGVFVDVTADWGLDLIDSEGASVATADIDADGDLDVYAGTLGSPNHLLLNTGTGFVDVGVAFGAILIESGVPFDAYGASFGDVDRDGDLDLVTADWYWIGNRLFVNDGAGMFTDGTEDAGLFEVGPVWGFSPVILDLDGDLAPEITVAADFGTSQYFANLGDGRFQRLTGSNGTCTDENGMGSAFADYDNDGDLDWFVTAIFDDDGKQEGNWGSTGNRLYRNDGSHQFTDVTDEAGVRNGYWGWGASFADFDHNGWIDLAMTNGFLPPREGNPDPTFEDDPTCLWIHRGLIGGATYDEVAAAAGLVHTASGKGLVTFDADGDGDLDVVITTNHGPLKLFRNDTDPTPSEWIQLDLVAPDGNAPDGIGATIELTIGDLTQHHAVHSAPSYMSHEPLRAHFGFPSTPAIDRIDVRWPDGTTTTRLDVTPGRIVTLRVEDLDLDGRVDTADLILLLTAWGPCPPLESGCPADANGDGLVDVSDLVRILAGWD